MNKSVYYNYIVLVLAVTSALIAIYVLFINPEISVSDFRIIIGFILGSISIFGFFIFYTVKKNYLDIAGDHNRYDILETLLSDAKGSGRANYKERRRSKRIDEIITARLANKDASELIKVINISYEGALLRTHQGLATGEAININMYLPLFAQPIEVKAKVVRTYKRSAENKTQNYDIGVEYLGMTPSDREKLIETVDLLNKTRELKK